MQMQPIAYMLLVCTSVISVQQFIFILVFIQFSVNHFYFYSVLVLSSFIHFSSYLVLVQAFTIILVLILFSFLINQIYEMYCFSTVSIQFKILLFSFRKTRISKFFYSRFCLPAIGLSIPQRGRCVQHMLLMLVPTTSPTPVAQDCDT